jgi:hypothetical protein
MLARDFVTYTFIGVAALLIIMNSGKFATSGGVLIDAFNTTSRRIIGSQA